MNYFVINGTPVSCTKYNDDTSLSLSWHRLLRRNHFICITMVSINSHEIHT